MIKHTEFEEAIKGIDTKKYHINRGVRFIDGDVYVNEWAIFRKDMSTEEYFDPRNLAVLSSNNNNTIEDILKFKEENNNGII